jgi:hypothetical protein
MPSLLRMPEVATDTPAILAVGAGLVQPPEHPAGILL